MLQSQQMDTLISQPLRQTVRVEVHAIKVGYYDNHTLFNRSKYLIGFR